MAPAVSSSAGNPVEFNSVTRDPIWLAWRLCRRELRSGIVGFRIYLACLSLGVASIAGISSVSHAIIAGLNADASSLLGGEVDLQLSQRPANEEQLAWLQANGKVSSIVETRTMARNPARTAHQLIELKAVDKNYPLFGEIKLLHGGSLSTALVRQDDVWSAVAGPGLLKQLGLKKGDLVSVGKTEFRIAGIIKHEPDRGTQVFALGPRLMVPLSALPETSLIKPGSLAHYHYRIDMDAPVHQWIRKLNERFGNAGWRIRDINNASPGLQQFVDRVTLFLTLVCLTTLLVGGVGVCNSVKAYLQSRTEVIATLKCIGATNRLIFYIYMLQILVLSLGGIATGLVIGVLMPLIAQSLIADYLPFASDIRIYPTALLLASTFGILVVLLFTLWPLSRVQSVPAASLFRDRVTPIDVRPSPKLAIGLCLIAVLLGSLAIISAEDKVLAFYFVGGAVAAFSIFRIVAILITRIARAIPRPQNPSLRLAITNLYKPGAPTTSVILSLGLGLTVLVSVTLIEGNISRQLGKTLMDRAPGFYFIDIQSDQIDKFDTFVSTFPGVESVGSVPMLRGRITKIAGTPVDQITSPTEFAWITRGDRGLTWMRNPPKTGSKIVAGEWWPEHYSGPPLISFDFEAARAFGLKIGDTLEINVLGRAIEAKIANLRLIDWNTLGINFVIIFSPGWLESAPQSHIATTHLKASAESALETAVTNRFPNVSAIRVREVLDNVNSVLNKVGMAVRSIAALAIGAGILVLSGTIVANHRQRVYEAVILKVLGATRRDILGVFAIEYLTLGLITAIISAITGSIVAWAVIIWVMEAEWVFIPSTVAITTILCILLTLSSGLVGSWYALGQKTAPLLRNE